ncbi:MAG: host specificity protein [Rhodobacteraceae bacterium]|nr:MAG: host specificity protein [Paracoccaceae bacterium]
MATLVLSAVGGAIGASAGGAAFGLSSVVIGRALGATAGRLLDGRLMGGGSAPVARGQVENFRVLGAREGAKISRVFGAMRVSGQIIWSTKFQENVDSSGGGKGSSSPVVNEYSYSISLAIALCEGEITRIGTVWADGKEISLDGVDYRLYRGDQMQMPDAAIVAVEGDGMAPSYRGTAYIVFENLDLTRFGNRIPQFNFEVVRKPEPLPVGEPREAAELVKAVALVPGTGEYVLATEPVSYPYGKGVSRPANVNGIGEGTDFVRSVKHMGEDLPNAESVSLVVSWFGDDLRCGSCTLQPAVEQTGVDGDAMPWVVSGQARLGAKVIGQIDERSAFGGTPADASVIQAIKHIQEQGKAVMFYPFILMDILDGNGLVNPWTGNVGQPAVPWRGRITTSAAPGVFGSPDQSAAAAGQVSDFFGAADVGDFVQGANGVSYTGPSEWSYRRFVLHYAHLCAAAGGVEAFCIGSEMRALTQVRDGLNSFPTVVQLVQLAADCRAILGPDCKIGYAADWSEYFGYQPSSGDVFYHLDPLWADDNIDFIGIDNYMPISDWRDGVEHLDDAYASIYDLEYLQSNIEGGEGFDWYYASDQARADQVRTPIVDGAHGEDWVYRYKDIRSWWSKQHHERIGGVRQVEGTDWLPGTKPIWFTEVGCPAVDKATNQPNVFDDTKSSESALPHFSNGNRDDLIQHRYLQAVLSYWADGANNPEASQYVGRMVDVARTHVWAWDARPFPDFPARLDVWSDGGAFARGHWVSGRVHMASLANVVAEICRRSGLEAVDVSKLYGLVRGFVIGDTESARQSLQPLMLAYGFDCFERDGVLVFRNRDGRSDEALDAARFVEEGEGAYSLTRNPDAETVGRVRVEFIDAENAYQMGAAEHVFPDESEAHTSESSLPLALSVGEGQAIAERWLSEARIARDEVSLAVAPSVAAIGVGDVVTVLGSDYRIDRIEEAGARRLACTRVEAGVYAPKIRDLSAKRRAGPTMFGPVYAEFLDLPLLDGSEVEHAFHLAASGDPWPGRVAVFSAGADYGYRLNTTLARSAVVGELASPLVAGRAGLWQRSGVRVKVASGYLASMPEADVLNGANRAALRGSGGDWEVFQFCNAELVADREYLLTKLLRGQAGTEFLIPGTWAVGTDFVLLNGAVSQVDLAAAERGLDRHYRIGAAHLPLDDGSYVHAVFAGQGVGLRPYAPVHLRAVVDGDVVVNWVRRTRIEGDVWQSYEVPLGEDREAYLVRVSSGGVVLREAEVLTPEFTYTSAMQMADGVSGVMDFDVAQISDRFGIGPFSKETVNV